MSEAGFLADTHVLLWWFGGDKRLSPTHRALIGGRAPIFVSSVSIAEVSIKVSTGKLRVDDDFAQRLRDSDFLELALSWRHAERLVELPFHHRDPFDRLLIAQALATGLTLLTDDADIRRYDLATA